MQLWMQLAVAIVPVKGVKGTSLWLLVGEIAAFLLGDCLLSRVVLVACLGEHKIYLMQI